MMKINKIVRNKIFLSNEEIMDINLDIKTKYDLKEDNKRYASIDLGLNNIVALTSNVSQSILYNGRPIKSINQHYNKHKAELQSRLKQNKHVSKRINRLTYKRNNEIKFVYQERKKGTVTSLGTSPDRFYLIHKCSNGFTFRVRNK